MKSLIIVKISITLFSTFFTQMAFAQVYVEQTTGPQHQATTVSVYGPDASSKKIPLSRIKGSPFWKEEWQLASLYDKNAQEMPHPLVLVAAGADGLALAVAHQRRAVAGRQSQQGGLVVGGQLPVIEQGHYHFGECATVF